MGRRGSRSGSRSGICAGRTGSLHPFATAPPPAWVPQGCPRHATAGFRVRARMPPRYSQGTADAIPDKDRPQRAGRVPCLLNPAGPPRLCGEAMDLSLDTVLGGGEEGRRREGGWRGREGEGGKAEPSYTCLCSPYQSGRMRRDGVVRSPSLTLGAGIEGAMGGASPSLCPSVCLPG